VNYLHYYGEPPTRLFMTEDGEIVSWKRAAKKLFGYSDSEAVYKACYDILEGMEPLSARVCHQR